MHSLSYGSKKAVPIAIGMKINGLHINQQLIFKSLLPVNSFYFGSIEFMFLDTLAFPYQQYRRQFYHQKSPTYILKYKIHFVKL